ncbi:MAG: hypothetical protein IJF18_06640 [Oscillospiraceae bacterium]|nr:hypothetical protein [Oscillospiraceae bacterium]
MNLKKSLCAVLAAACVMTSVCAVPASADWKTTSAGKKYVDDSGSYVTGWQTIDGKKYYFKSNGIMHKGWLRTSSGKKYYFNSDGTMRTGWMKTAGGNKYYFRKNGVMAADVKIKISGKVYKFDKNGVLVTSDSSSSSVNKAEIRKLMEEAQKNYEQYDKEHKEIQKKRDEHYKKMVEFSEYCDILTEYMNDDGTSSIVYNKLKTKEKKIIDDIVDAICEVTKERETAYWQYINDDYFYWYLANACSDLYDHFRDLMTDLNSDADKALRNKTEWVKKYNEYKKQLG